MAWRRPRTHRMPAVDEGPGGRPMRPSPSCGRGNGLVVTHEPAASLHVYKLQAP
jgi:hypothetical protein